MNGLTGAQHSAEIEPRLLMIPASDTLLQLFGVAEQTKANQLAWLLYRFYLEIAVKRPRVYWLIFVWKCPAFSHSGVTLRKTSEFLLILLHVGERNTLLQFPPTVPCDQPFLSRLQSIYPSPSCAPPRPPRPTPPLKQSSITLIPLRYPLLNLPPSSPAPSSRVVPSGWLWGPPNPVAVSHPAPASWARADSSMSKSIIIFGQCNPIPEDIL